MVTTSGLLRWVTKDDGTITSELDIAGPNAAKNLLVEIERPAQDGFPPPRLSELVIHFNDWDDGSVYIPGSACHASEWSNAAYTCTMLDASIGSTGLCPAEYAANDPITQMFAPRCAVDDPKVASP